MSKEEFITKTELVGVAWSSTRPGAPSATMAYGTVISRATAAFQDGESVDLVGIRFPGQNLPVWVPEDSTHGVSLEASVIVDHDDMPSLEDSALAYCQWLRGADEVYVTVKARETHESYSVRVTYDEATDTWTAEKGEQS